MQSPEIRIDDADVFELSRAALDELPFGVITLDRSGTILRFNLAEETLARRHAVRNIGLNFFSDVAPCTNVRTFRGRFDAFAASYESGAERFTFSFAFRWGRQDVSITMLRKAGFEEINILVRGRSMGGLPEARQTDDGLPARLAPEPMLPALTDVRALSQPRKYRLDRGTAADAQTLRERVHPDDIPAVGAVIAAAIREGIPYGVEDHACGPGRRIVQEHGYLDSDPAGVGYAIAVDVTAARRLEADTWRAAHYDALTGLPNQKLLLMRIADAIREAESSGRIAAVLIANINGFRTLNNTFGRSTGNELLCAAALRLGECVRGGDTVARIAADWFVVLLTDVDSPASIAAAATRMIATVAQPIEIAGRAHHLALRVGVSLAPYDGTDPARVLSAAETALFAAKATGRSEVRYYSADLAREALNSHELQNELREALRSGQFELAYQPLVDISNGRVVAVEALVRWNHPSRGTVSPLDFIPVADRSGLIVPLGEWVLRTACAQAQEWAERGIDVRVCVNVSSVQFARPDFVELVAAVLADCGLAANRLELELTESILVDGFGDMMDTLTRLKALGLRLAIDDFGTGYSSLSYLKYFPVDTLKIDRAFITDIVADKFDHAIATTILTLAKSLALECVVEGVESVEQLETLRDLGCRYVQGYFFSRPQTALALTGLLLEAGDKLPVSPVG